MEPRTSEPSDRLEGDKYEKVLFGWECLIQSRFNEICGGWLYIKAPYCARTVDSVIDIFRPDAVLTVTHLYGLSDWKKESE